MIAIFKKLFTKKNNADMKNLIQQGFLVDVRSALEFTRGNVPGSVNIPLDELPQKIDMIRNKEAIIVFCQSGGRAGIAKSLLEKNGFGNVTNAGGWQSVKQIIDDNN